MGALSDITVLDMSRILAGPFGTQILADLGATVWKIESPWGTTLGAGVRRSWARRARTTCRRTGVRRA